MCGADANLSVVGASQRRSRIPSRLLNLNAARSPRAGVMNVRTVLLRLAFLALLVDLAQAGTSGASPDTPVEDGAACQNLQQATQALVDGFAPGDRAVWERYTDPSFVYVTENNEVQSRARMLEELKPLPPGYSGQIAVTEFHCRDFGRFAVTTYVMDEHENVEGQLLHAHYRESDTWRMTARGWRLVAGQAFAILQDPPRTQLPPERLTDYEGTYDMSATTHAQIRREGDHLVAERAGREPQQLVPESPDVFFTPGRPRTRRLFTRASDGRVVGFVDRREGVDLVWKRAADPPH
jgi:hypothetical protein